MQSLGFRDLAGFGKWTSHVRIGFGNPRRESPAGGGGACGWGGGGGVWVLGFGFRV